MSQQKNIPPSDDPKLTEKVKPHNLAGDELHFEMDAGLHTPEKSAHIESQAIIPTALSSQRSLAPHVTIVREILAKSNLEATQQLAVNASLEQLEKIESQHTANELAKKSEEGLIKQLESMPSSVSAKAMVEAIKLSKGYFVDIDFDKEGKLEQVTDFNIRHTGIQDRHVTPIVIIEKIIGNTLQKKATPSQIQAALLSAIELFKNKMNTSDNEYIQNIFSYFSNPKYATPGGVKFLIKLAAHVYNENISLAFSNKYIAIPDNTNDCYLIPTLAFGGEKLYHVKEGSFISALGKIMAKFDEKASHVDLEERERKQMIYAVFSMFDYLPLPLNAVNPPRNFDKNNHRYVGEELERLQRVAGNHLLFILEAYPHLWSKYQKEMIGGFLQYVMQGVPIADLLQITNKTSITNLATAINMTESVVKEKFSNESNSSGARGFKQQYGDALNDFPRLVQLFLAQRDHSYIDSTPIKETSKPWSTPEKIKLDKENDIENAVIDILYLHYQFNEAAEKNFKNLDAELQKLLGLNGENFDQEFKSTLSKIIEKEGQISANALRDAVGTVYRGTPHKSLEEYSVADIEELESVHTKAKQLNPEKDNPSTSDSDESYRPMQSATSTPYALHSVTPSSPSSLTPYSPSPYHPQPSKDWSSMQPPTPSQPERGKPRKLELSEDEEKEQPKKTLRIESLKPAAASKPAPKSPTSPGKGLS